MGQLGLIILSEYWQNDKCYALKVQSSILFFIIVVLRVSTLSGVVLPLQKQSSETMEGLKIFPKSNDKSTLRGDGIDQREIHIEVEKMPVLILSFFHYDII